MYLQWPFGRYFRHYLPLWRRSPSIGNIGAQRQNPHLVHSLILLTNTENSCLTKRTEKRTMIHSVHFIIVVDIHAGLEYRNRHKKCPASLFLYKLDDRFSAWSRLNCFCFSVRRWESGSEYISHWNEAIKNRLPALINPLNRNCHVETQDSKAIAIKCNIPHERNALDRSPHPVMSRFSLPQSWIAFSRRRFWDPSRVA